MDNVEILSIQYVSGTAGGHHCGEEAFTYFQIEAPAQ